MANSQPDKPAAIEFLAKFDTTVLAGLVFLGLGGAIISFYYSHIRYLPDIEWSQSIVHLATATLIGGGFATLFGLSLFLPGCMWSAFLLRDEKLTDAFWFRETDEDEVCLRTLLRNIGLPFGVFVFANHLVLLDPVPFCSWQRAPSPVPFPRLMRECSRLSCSWRCGPGQVFTSADESYIKERLY